MAETTLFDNETNRLVPIPTEGVQDALASGKYLVPMLDPTGKPVALAPDEAKQKLQEGWSEPDPAHVQQIRLQHDEHAKYGESGMQQVGALGEGVLRGGLDVAAGAAGLVGSAVGHPEWGTNVSGQSAEKFLLGDKTAEEAKLRAEYNPGTAAAGQFIGQGLSLGPAGELLGGLKAASVVGRIAKSAVLFGAIGAGQTVDESALGNTELTAAKLGAAFTMSALGAGATEGLFSLGEAAVPRVVEAAGEATDSLKAKINAWTEKAALAGPEGTKQVDNTVRAVHEATVKTADAFQDFINETRGMRQKENENLLMTHDPAVAQAGADSALEALQMRIQGLAEEAGSRKEGIGEAAALVDNLRMEVADAPTSAAKLNLINDAKTQVNGFKDKFDNLSPGIKGVSSALKDITEDTNTFGDAAIRQKEFNGPLSDYLNLMSPDRRDTGALMKEIGKLEKFRGLLPEGRASSMYRPDAVRLKAALEKVAGGGIEGDRLKVMFDALDKATSDLVAQGEKTAANVAKDIPSRSVLDELFTRKAATEADALSTIKRVGDAQFSGGQRSLGTKVGAVVGGFAGRAVGHAVAGPAGGALGGMGGAAIGAMAGGGAGARLSAEGVATLGKMALTVADVNRQIIEGIGSFLSNPVVQGAAKLGASQGAHRFTLGSEAASTDPATGKPAEDPHQKLFNSIDNLNNNVIATANMMAGRTKKMSHAAPKISTEYQIQHAQKLRYIQAHIPRDARAPSMLRSKSLPPSHTQKHAFNIVMRAVHSPMTLIDDLKNGVLMPQAVEAVAATSPSLYDAYVGEAVQQLSDNPDRQLSYSQRGQLAVLFGHSVDPTTDPDFIGFMQNLAQTHGAPMQDQSAGDGKVSQAGIEKLDVANMEKTDTQHLMTRQA
jgi:hypothetical protein